MDACLATKTPYVDTANYEPEDTAKFEYKWQWAYRERFEQAGLTAILGCGFDPGVCSIFTAYAAKHYFDEIHYLDIVDCNAGDHHKAFATNFNPEINIREITQKGLYYEDGKWLETDPLAVHKTLNYPNVGPRESYLMHRGAGEPRAQFPDHQARSLLDDLRTAVSHLSRLHHEPWYGTHRRGHLRGTARR